MNVFTSIFISSLIRVIRGAQRQTIPGSEQSFRWGSNTDAWAFEYAVLGSYSQCPSGGACVCLEGGPSDIKTNVSSVGYYSTNAEWSIRTESLNNTSLHNHCKLFYNVGGTGEAYTNVGFFASDAQATSYSIPLPQADNEDIIGIWFYLMDTFKDAPGAAYINDFKLTGIKITPPPTRYPTINPTTATSNPTLSPTTFPTLEPTVSPTLDPTISPTKPPTPNTPNPTISPTQSTKSPTKPPTEHPSKSPSKQPSKSPTQYPSKPPTFNPTRPPTFEYEYTTETARVPGTSDDSAMYGMVVRIGLSVIAFLVCICGSLLWYFYRQNKIEETQNMIADNGNDGAPPKVLAIDHMVKGVSMQNDMADTGSETETRSVEMMDVRSDVQTPQVPNEQNEDGDDDDDSSVLDEDEGNAKNDDEMTMCATSEGPVEGDEIMMCATVEGPTAGNIETIPGPQDGTDPDVDNIEIMNSNVTGNGDAFVTSVSLNDKVQI
eukprot:237439_1